MHAGPLYRVVDGESTAKRASPSKQQQRRLIKIVNALCVLKRKATKRERSVYVVISGRHPCCRRETVNFGSMFGVSLCSRHSPLTHSTQCANCKKIARRRSVNAYLSAKLEASPVIEINHRRGRRERKGLSEKTRQLLVADLPISDDSQPATPRRWREPKLKIYCQV